VVTTSATIELCDPMPPNCNTMYNQAIATRASYGADHGDSGGPVYRYLSGLNNTEVDGYGLVSGVNSDQDGNVIGTQMTFTKILTALTALNLGGLATLSSP